MARTEGDFYAWHCDWCDSTTYTVWTKVASEGLVCGACHRPAGEAADDYPVFMQAHLPAVAGMYA